jgi:methylase of polypeptide subunit release factors
MASDVTAARQSIIGALYQATLERSKRDQGSDAFEIWLTSTLSVRGPLERKRAADRNKIGKFLGIDHEDVDLERFAFAVETYLAVRADLLVEIATSERSTAEKTESREYVMHAVAAAVDSSLDRLLSSSWILGAFDRAKPGSLDAECTTAASLTSRLRTGPLFDALQADHHALIPKELRHMVGAYYTPQWLASHVVRKSGYDGMENDLSHLSILDPTCGSGVFLVAAAEELRRAAAAELLDQDKARALLINNFYGMDVDPLAITNAKANLRLAAITLGDGSDEIRSIDFPGITCSDSLDRTSAAPTVNIVFGNPPWVNWEYLPPDYRAKHAMLWPELGLFALKGKERAFSKEDVSALFFATAIDRYLLDGGKLSFVVPQSLVKSSLNHRAFRRFSLRGGVVRYEITEVDDMVALRPFEGVSNRTIVMYAKRGQKTQFPVPYHRWLRSGKNSFEPSTSPVVEEVAVPSNPEDTTSHWSTGTSTTITALAQIGGESFYRARTGLFTGGANGVYHLELKSYGSGVATFTNITERAKRVVPKVEATLETEFVYPLLRGRELDQWKYGSEFFTLLPHTAETKMEPVAEATLRQCAPRTYAYFAQFRELLDERAGFTGWEKKVLEVGFYACQRIGEYTFSPWKVAWRYIAPKFTCAVVGPYEDDGPFLGKPVIPNEKLMTIACSCAEEAYFLCGLLSSSCAISFVHSRMVSTQIAPHLIQGLALPEYDPSSNFHNEIAQLCEAGHKSAKSGQTVDPSILVRLDELSAGILGASAEGARQLRHQLIEDGFTY